MKQNNNRYNNRPNTHRADVTPVASNDISEAPVVEKETEEVTQEVEVAPEVEVEAVSEPAPKDEPKKDIPQIAAINVDLCNVRKAPSPTADILGTAIKNAEFRVDKEKTGNGYVAINFGDILGYIREDLVRVYDNPAYVAHDVRKM